MWGSFCAIDLSNKWWNRVSGIRHKRSYIYLSSLHSSRRYVQVGCSSTRGPGPFFWVACLIGKHSSPLFFFLYIKRDGKVIRKIDDEKLTEKRRSWKMKRPHGGPAYIKQALCRAETHHPFSTFSPYFNSNTYSCIQLSVLSLDKRQWPHLSLLFP